MKPSEFEDDELIRRAGAAVKRKVGRWIMDGAKFVAMLTILFLGCIAALYVAGAAWKWKWWVIGVCAVIFVLGQIFGKPLPPAADDHHEEPPV